MPLTMMYCIGIDGGGTKTEGVLTDCEGHVLACLKYGASNPNDIGFDASVCLLAEMIRDLLQVGGNIPAESVSVFAGIAGALAHREALCAAIRNEIPSLGALSVDSDVINLLSAATPSGQGICLICGTGSVCFARKNNTVTRIGGWGYLLDDAGGGYDIGRMALLASLKAYDGRADKDEAFPLTEALTQHYQKPPQELIPNIYANGKPYIASCAPVVFRLARQGDALSERILQINAEALAACLATACLHFPNENTIPVILGGSINVKESPMWSDRIKNALPQSLSPVVDIRILQAPPVFGALAEALRAIQDYDGENAFLLFQSEFLASYLS